MFYEIMAQLCIDDADKGDYGLLKLEMLKIHMTNNPFSKNGLPKDPIGLEIKWMFDVSCSS
jgi:hypothetical protein